MAIVYCLLAPLAFMAVLIGGYVIFAVIMNHVNFLSVWADKQINQIQWDDDEE